MPTTNQPSVPGEVVFAGISETPLAVDVAWDAVESDHTGAVVTFGGIVRNHDGGRAVTQLNYSAHPSAPARMLELVTEVAARHPGTRLWAAHRVGELHIGDAALVAAAASAHRGAAFEACRDLVETVKAHVPVWKEQFFADGEVQWVGSA
ncbi:molybdenum cofactor biosynthesis protein MoaE [Paeniglutamicibacter terrestris]|uniref:Molybdenum cofactor biosynthesis protein MoaE n=1 Tax=Paeniglutamicibacter terrestris TaxID=2723403 RepID=A0ABX1G6U7_9MICC|nr:molybdenum cofactor biosynthesis protein MoaE [Paeniglutamicibacter terrestris]NKG21974.1 molybdenum cofactor biosynthesis protein MoaE [Paeniglutamicibacter terrestris]